jgi:hypothetical protein
LWHTEKPAGNAHPDFAALLRKNINQNRDSETKKTLKKKLKKSYRRDVYVNRSVFFTSGTFGGPEPSVADIAGFELCRRGPKCEKNPY